MASLMMIAVLAVGFLAGPAFAQDTGTQVESKSWIEAYVIAGGWIGFVILFCSFVSLALIIEHVVNIKRDKIVPPQLIDEIEGMFENEEYQEALELCEAEQNFLTNILAAGLPKINAGFETMKAAMDEAAEEEAIKLQQKIGYLSLIGNIAPMMGLFGTVSGMIAAFQTIAAMGAAVTPADLADGISQALVTTFLGLLVAIPTMIAYFFFRNRVVRVTLEIGAIADDLVDRFRGK
ncbi:MAG: MotA/TolQ/ExbB proton channel family protein [Planctomycetes bacterium]|nr:MotA/TolQ/ExbB proton channel family protein [Planctomycetota bacterium]